MRIDLSGKTVLVTGAARGIGAAISRAFAAAGARTAVHYVRSDLPARNLAEEIGGGAEAFGADLEDPEACLKLWSDVVERFGRVDVLVNNAGVALALAAGGGGRPLDRRLEPHPGGEPAGRGRPVPVGHRSISRPTAAGGSSTSPRAPATAATRPTTSPTPPPRAGCSP